MWLLIVLQYSCYFRSKPYKETKKKIQLFSLYAMKLQSRNAETLRKQKALGFF